jgi:hypothetical protein
MPYLRFKGFDEGFLHEQAELFVAEFARVAVLPPEIVKIELLPIVPITGSPLSLEILMFPRSQKRHDRIARCLNELLAHFGFPEVHIFFVPLNASLYYKQGLPLHEVSWLKQESEESCGNG